MITIQSVNFVQQLTVVSPVHVYQKSAQDSEARRSYVEEKTM